jgi:transcriptional antiterminator RfaH
LNAPLQVPVLRWYLILTKPSAEAVAQSNLERQGYEVYLPRLVEPLLCRHQRRERIVPLFPRYLFLRLMEGSQPLAPVRSSVGVSGVVRFGCRYAIVPDETICRLRRRADPMTGLHHLAKPAPLVSGTAVLIASGPFDGLEGIFQREDGAERAIVLLNLLGHDTPVRVPTAWILPQGDSRRAAPPRPGIW